MLLCVMVCYGMLQCVTVCCGVLRCVTVRVTVCNTAQTLPPFLYDFFPVHFVKLYLELTIKYHLQDYFSTHIHSHLLFMIFFPVHFVKLYLELTIKHHMQDYSSAASD
jgi:hypothetical protein